MMPFAAYLGLKFAPDFYSGKFHIENLFLFFWRFAFIVNRIIFFFLLIWLGFLPLLNSAVHAVMYSYYALACAGKYFCLK